MDVDPKFAAEFLRDEVMTVIKAELSKPWKIMNESEQEWAATRIEFICKQAITKVCDAIAKVGTVAITGSMGALATDKDRNPKIPITFGGSLSDAEKLAIWSHIGRSVVVVLMDPQSYQNFKKKVDVEPDQPELPVEEGNKQPDWATVAAALKDEGPEVIDVADMNKGDAPDAHEPVEEEVPEDSLLDDDDDMPAAEVAKMVNIPDPTTKKKKAG